MIPRDLQVWIGWTLFILLSAAAFILINPFQRKSNWIIFYIIVIYGILLAIIEAIIFSFFYANRNPIYYFFILIGISIVSIFLWIRQFILSQSVLYSCLIAAIGTPLSLIFLSLGATAFYFLIGKKELALVQINGLINYKVFLAQFCGALIWVSTFGIITAYISVRVADRLQKIAK